MPVVIARALAMWWIGCAAIQCSHGTTIMDLQPFARSQSILIESNDGRHGTATLTSINPTVNVGYLLTLQWNGASILQFYHLENARPREQSLRLQGTDPRRIVLVGTGGDASCDLWWSASPNALERARNASVPFAPLCDDRLYLRNTVPGGYTQLERTTNLLRDHVWGGDRIVTFVREEFFKDAFIEQGERGAGLRLPPAPPASVAPQAAQLDAAQRGLSIRPAHLGLDLGPSFEAVALGQWYELPTAPGIFFSAIQPQAIAPKLLSTYPDRVATLDAVEGVALDYFVAFDLDRFDIGFALGTDHPRLDWSPRVPASQRDPLQPGPDGFDSAAPLVRTGMANPELVARTVATFTGGFKREHGAFHHGELAVRNRGSHYGFIEQGTLFSTLQPGLATLLVFADGSVDMKTWTAADVELQSKIVHARQNGVALIEPEAATAAPAPGKLVNQWGAGNWSGSQDAHLRTLRAGMCLQQTPTHRFLIYGYFSTATPSAMARAFQAYDCRYAMHLDMNALEHTYLAIYARSAGEIRVQHLVASMSQVDRKVGSQPAPRFVAYPDNRDFFYVLRRESRP